MVNDFDPARELAEGGAELLSGLRALLYADDPSQATVDALRNIEARLADDGLRHMTADEIAATPTDQWLALNVQDRNRILREATEQERAVRAAAPQETDQQRRVREFDADMATWSAEQRAREARRAENLQRAEQVFRAPDDDAALAREAMRRVNARIAREGF